MSLPDPNELNDLLAFALHLAEQTEPVILPHFRADTAVSNKLQAGFDPVTVADTAAEKAMRQLIEERFPDHGIFGEELGIKEGTSPYTWILDPIDGTRSFIFGSVVWTTLIGLTYEGTPVIGVMNQPYVRETFFGSPAGAFCRRDGSDRRLHVRPADRLSEALVTTTAPALYKSPQEVAFLEQIKSAARSIRYDGDAYFYSLVAAGQIDIALDAGLQSYDIAPLVPIIEAAGGVVSTWSREPATHGGNIIAAASRELYDKALALLEG